jgi:DNA-binding XRE family transcriptional regulator
MSSDTKSYPHLEVQITARNLLVSALHLAQLDEKAGAQDRRASLLELVNAYQTTVDELNGTTAKRSAPAIGSLTACTASTSPSPQPQSIRATRMQRANSPEPPAIRAARMPAADFRRAVMEGRKANGWSQSQAASQLGISKRTLQDWEQGRYQPKPTTVMYVIGRILSQDRAV